MYSLSLFTVNKEAKVFIAEASDLGDVDRVLGSIHIKNPKTGVIVEFIYSSQEWYGEGEDREVGFWVYRPSARDLNRHPKLAGWTITVLND